MNVCVCMNGCAIMPSYVATRIFNVVFKQLSSVNVHVESVKQFFHYLLRNSQRSDNKKSHKVTECLMLSSICHIKAYTCPDCGTVMLCPDRCMQMPNNIDLCSKEAIYTLLMVSVNNACRHL